MSMGEQYDYASNALVNLLYQSGAKVGPIVRNLPDVATEGIIRNPRAFTRQISQALLEDQKKGPPNSEELVQTVAENMEPVGYIIMVLLFQCQGDTLPVSEEVIKAAVGNKGDFGPLIVELLLQHRGASLVISEEVVKVAAGNVGLFGPKIMKLLTQHQGDSLPVSEEVVKAAAENDSEIMELVYSTKGMMFQFPKEWSK